MTLELFIEVNIFKKLDFYSLCLYLNLTIEILCITSSYDQVRLTESINSITAFNLEIIMQYCLTCPVIATNSTTFIC